MDEVAFVDASPLILLSRAGRLDLVRVAGRTVVAPRAVLDEIAAYGPDDPEWCAIRAATWISTADPAPAPPAIQGWDLGPGETQVLTLAKATPGSIAVLDDREARRCARAVGVPVRGTLGLLLVARARGELTLVRPLVEALRRGGMRISDDVVDAALREVGE